MSDPYRTPAVAAATPLERGIDCVRIAEVLLHAYLVEQQQFGMTAWSPDFARVGQQEDAYANMRQSYCGFWEQADAAGQYLLDARLDVQSFWALSNGRRLDYFGFEDRGASIAFDVRETQRAQQALHELKIRVPTTWQPAPFDPQAASYLSKVQGRDSMMKGVLWAMGVLGFIILLIVKVSRFCS